MTRTENLTHTAQPWGSLLPYQNDPGGLAGVQTVTGTM